MNTNDSNSFDQNLLNQPIAHHNEAEDEAFLDLVLGLIGTKKIDLYKPSSLLNEAVYGAASDEARRKADFEAVQMIATVREIKDLCDHGFRESFQVENLVYRLRVTKERLEEAGGDLFII